MEKAGSYKHIQLRQYFISLAKHGKIDKPLPSERVLAEMFQVSRVTVRASLTAMVEEKYLIRCPRRGYFVNPGSFADVARSRKLVGLIFYTGELAFYDDDAMHYIREICEQCIQNNILLQILTPSRSSMYTDLSTSNLDGLIWINADSGCETFEKLCKNINTPIVGLFNVKRPECGNYVYLNHYNEFFLRTQYLIQRGAKRIVTYDLPYCIDGYKDALKNAGLPYCPELVVPQNRFEEALPDLYDKYHADAFSIRATEYFALQRFIDQRGLSVPHDIQYIFDNLNEVSQGTITVKPFRKIISTMIKHLLNVMDGKKSELQNDSMMWTIKPGFSTRTL